MTAIPWRAAHGPGRARVAAVVLAALFSACRPGPPGALEPTHPDGAIVASPRLGERPYGAAISQTGLVFVTRLDAATVSGAMLPDTVFTSAVAVRHVPTDVAFNRAGTRAFVTNQHSQQVGIVDVASGRQVDSLMFGGDPARVLVSADDRSLFVTINTGELFRIDLATRAVTVRLRFPDLANGLALGRRGDLLYASTIEGTVAEITTATNTARRTFRIGGKLQGLAVSPDGTEMFIADETGGRLIVWSLARERALDTVPLEGAPFDVRITPDGTLVYVSVRTAGQVMVFDRASRKHVATILTGGDPRRIAFDPAGGLAVVANQAGWVDFVR